MLKRNFIYMLSLTVDILLTIGLKVLLTEKILVQVSPSLILIVIIVEIRIIVLELNSNIMLFLENSQVSFK